MTEDLPFSVVIFTTSLSTSRFCPETLGYPKPSACLNGNYDSVILPQNCPGAEILTLFQLSELKVVL